jgi:hypothetical protein
MCDGFVGKDVTMWRPKQLGGQYDDQKFGNIIFAIDGIVKSYNRLPNADGHTSAKSLTCFIYIVQTEGVKTTCFRQMQLTSLVRCSNLNRSYSANVLCVLKRAIVIMSAFEYGFCSCSYYQIVYVHRSTLVWPM